MVKKMKINKYYIFFVIMGCILAVGCTTISTTDEKPTPPDTSSNLNIIPTTILPQTTNLPGTNTGQLVVSIGGYNAQFPVIVDDKNSGTVSQGKPLKLNLSEGIHTIKICSGDACDTVDVNILSAITTTIDFEERLNRDLPQGSLNVSIGYYNANIPVYIDNSRVGNVSPGKPLSQKVSAGSHSVKICIQDDCYTEDVNVTTQKHTLVDFESRLRVEGRMADLIVSIGGYNAQKLPVFLDNISVGVASQGDPLTIRVSTGVHEVKVCSGAVCPTKKTEVNFGKQNFIDFGDELIKNAEFQEPTVRIIDYTVSGNTMILNTEFINPDVKEHIMTATFSCSYSYIDSNRNRIGSSSTGQLTRTVRAGNRTLASTNLVLSGGRDYLTSPPVVLSLITT